MLSLECLLCGAATKLINLCPACIADFPVVTPACRRCGTWLSAGDVCGSCLKNPPPFSCYVGIHAYCYPIDRLIIEAKYQDKLHVAATLGCVFVQGLNHTQQLEIPEALVPVPLHRRRLAQRGYNQAVELARPVARHFGIPLIVDAPFRSRNTLSQASLDGKYRSRNVAGAFAMGRPLGHKHVAIIDDVYTTGATVKELAKCLLTAGCRRVDVWTLARAGLPRMN